MRKKIMCVMVTFNPDKEKIQLCIESIINQIEKFVIIDNASSIDFTHELEKKFPSISIVRNEKNIGLSRAYNTAINLAQENSFAHLLLLDQDTICSRNMIEELLKNDYNNFVCLVPFKHHRNKEYQNHLYRTNPSDKPHGDCEVVKSAINSGTCINLKNLPTDVKFNENLFVDCIDWDFYLQLRKRGLKVLRVNTAEILVEIGNITKHKFFKHTWFAKNYSPKRLEICGKDFIVFLKMNRKMGWKALKFHVIYTIWTYWMIIFEKNRIKKYISLCKGLFQGFFTKVS